MDIAKPEAKLRELNFFLKKMQDLQRYIELPETEPFAFYMNAFLSAASSLRDCFRKGGDKQAARWQKNWEAQLTPQEEALYDYLRVERNIELHRGGSRRKHKTKQQHLAPGSYELTPGTRGDVAGPPDVLVQIDKQVLFFTIEGNERNALEACAEFAGLLERLMAEYKATHCPAREG